MVLARPRLGLRSKLRRLLGREPKRPPLDWTYDEDGLRTIHDASFVRDARFLRAYERGKRAAGGTDYRWRWRVHVGLWADRKSVV